MPTRIVDVDILEGLPEIPPLADNEGLLVIVRAGPSLVGQLFAPPHRAGALSVDLRRNLPSGISRERFRQAREAASAQDRSPGEIPFDELCETFRIERELLKGPREELRVSVIVSTRGRREALVRCLESLVNLEYENYELILVDNNGPSEGVFDLAGHFTCRYVKEVRAGLSWGLNAGLREATGDVVAITHDDAEVDRHWLGGLTREFEDPEVAAVAGPVLPMELATPGQERFEELGYGGPPFVARRVFGPNDARLGLRAGSDANVAFRREALLSAGGFEVSLGPGTWSGGSEDSDALLRLLERGCRVVFTPHAVVRHRHRVDLEEVLNLAFQRAVSRVAMLTCRVHRDRRQLGPVLRHIIRSSIGFDTAPRGERLGYPRAKLPLIQRLTATLAGPIAYALSVSAARDPWPSEGDEAS